MRNQVFKIVFQKIGNPDGFELSCRIRVLERFPHLYIFFKIAFFLTPFRPRLGTVNQHQIDIVQTQFFERCIDGFGGCVIGFGLRRHLACKEKRFPMDPAGPDADADASFVAVGLRGVYMTIADFHGGNDRLSRFIIVYKPSPKPQNGDFSAVA